MKLPVFNIPLSIKAVVTFLVAAALNTISQLLHVEVSEGVRVWVSGGIALAVAFAVKEGVPYINVWLKKNGIPADIETKA